ncbi:MAG: cytochrome c family protein [Caulobacterales bacterium]|nr:cytochrome c family protein [Caulobacterales bacterium]
MSDLTFNKIAGGLLATGLVIFGLRELTAIVFEHEPPEKAGYAVTVAEAASEGGSVAEVAPDWGTVIPVTSPDLGKAISAKCASCHTFDAGGANGTGPNLFGVLGGKPGSRPGFAYSPAMTEYAASHPVWTWDELDQFVKAPQKHIAGTKMTFVGLKKQDDRVAMLAYLHSLGSTLPLPAPKPAAAPTTAAAEGAAPAPTDAAPPAAAPATPAAH